MEAMDIQAVESKLSDVTVTAIPMSGKNIHKELNHGSNSHATISTVPASSPSSVGKDKDNGMSKYAQLLAVIEEMGMLPWEAKLKWHTGLSADSVEWCPVEPYRDFLVCGTYQLDQGEQVQENKQKRIGKIYLFTITEETTALSPIQTVDTSGVLDQKWSYHPLNGLPTLAVATSIGTIQLYQLKDDKLQLWTEHLIGGDVLALSLDWSTNRTPSNEPRLVVSDSSGAVTVLTVDADGVKDIGQWNSHSYEAWIAAFNYWNDNVFYSGGDDCLFKAYDIRVPGAAVIVNKTHEAGVTTARSHTHAEHSLVTGSYDENIRWWDTRNLKSSEHQVNVSGGVWRLKWRPLTSLKAKECVTELAAACMYGGLRRLRQQSVLAEYLHHDSIAYGVDWSHSRNLLATCSFYDCQLHISDVIDQ